MKILFVTSEVATIYKRGGLADVSYALPVALSKRGVQASIAMPFYEEIPSKNTICVGQLAIDFDRRRELVFIFRTILPHTHLRVYLFRHPLLNKYDDDRIVDRFAFFSKAVAQLCLYSQEMLGGPYDIIHCNDWHTALIPLIIGEQNKTGFRERETIQSSRFQTMLTIHNLLYSGETSLSIGLKLGIPSSLLHDFSTPLGKAVRLLEEGMEYADVVSTVSPTYAKEIMRGTHGARVPEVFTRRNDRIIGILNGIDTQLWDPATDTNMPEKFSKHTVLQVKPRIKTLLQNALKLPVSDVPLFGFVGRFENRQKGLDLIAKALEKLDPTTYQIALLGTGQKALVTMFTSLAKKYPNVSFTNTFDERLARRIYAGSDIMLVPSKFEPCGLTQLIAMRYGTLPLVRKTGGLADTVTDGKTGFVFTAYTRTALLQKMLEAIGMYQQNRPHFQKMIQTVMATDYSWQHQVKEYIALYKKLIQK